MFKIPGSGSSILDEYTSEQPSPQNTIDIFEGEWSSAFPGSLATLRAGSAQLFEDARVDWAAERLGGIEGRSVLELGPLEAGHTYLLEQRNAASILAVEANSRAYLKCLIVKEILGLTRARFLYGDFVEYLRSTSTQFDLCFASGVLYHMEHPAELVSLIAGVTDRMFIWTHYYDESNLAQRPELAYRLTDGVSCDHAGFEHKLYRQTYGAALKAKSFCGAGRQFSHWMARDDIFALLRHLGFTEIETGFDHPHHPNGPSVALAASRPRR